MNLCLLIICTNWTICRGGGVDIFIKDNLNVTVSLAASLPKQFDCLVLNVGLGHNNQLTLVGVYRPLSAPSCSLSNSDTLMLSKYGKSEPFILGDFNIDCGTPVSDTLKDICYELHLSQPITEPTWPHPKDPSIYPD